MTLRHPMGERLVDDAQARLDEFLYDGDRVRTPAEATEFLALLGALKHLADHRGLRETAKRLRQALQAAHREMRQIGADELRPNGLTRRP